MTSLLQVRPEAGTRPIDIDGVRGGSGPVLITGAPRSGTTWAAKVLSASRGVAFVDEPFNPIYRPSRVSPVLDVWFRYVCEDNAHEFLPRLEKTFGLRYPLRQVGTLRDRGEWKRFAAEAVSSLVHRVHRSRVVTKDPIAVFSAPWLADAFEMSVIACVRHPAAFVSSNLKLGWEFDFQNLLRQPLFMRDCAGRLAPEIERMAATSGSLIDRSILLWRIIYTRVHEYQRRHPEWIIVRHEDLASSPVERFSDVARRCGLDWSQEMAEFAKRSSSVKNPGEVSTAQWNSVMRNSGAAARTWHQRLTKEQIHRVREGTEEEAGWFYDDRDWSVG